MPELLPVQSAALDPAIASVFRIFLAAALCCVAAAGQAQTFSSLEERMSAREFKEAGLDQLSETQLAKLNEWLRTHGTSGSGFSGAIAAPANADRRGFYEEPGGEDAIDSRILGEFRGWKGEGTRFELENGQVWVSTDPSASLSVKLRDPNVHIKPGLLKAWYLKVEGYNTSVRVKRIK